MKKVLLVDNGLLRESLKFDALDTAEKITGKSYKDDSSTSFLGMALMHQNNAIKNRVLKLNDDTTFSATVVHYLSVLKDEGFTIVAGIPFLGTGWNDDPTTS